MTQDAYSNLRLNKLQIFVESGAKRHSQQKSGFYFSAKRCNVAVSIKVTLVECWFLVKRGNFMYQ